MERILRTVPFSIATNLVMFLSLRFADCFLSDTERKNVEVRKKMKNITISLAVNMDNSVKLTLLIIGKFLKLCYLKNYKFLPIS